MTHKRLLLATAMGCGIVVTTVLLWSPPSLAQLPGGVIPGEENQPYIMSGSVIVVVSPKNDAVFAYSKHTGTWQKQTVGTPPKQKIEPTVSNEVVVLQAGNKIYAFSGPQGRWDALTLNDGLQPHVTTMYDMVMVHTKNQYHAFSVKTASWASLDMETEK